MSPRENSMDHEISHKQPRSAVYPWLAGYFLMYVKLRKVEGRFDYLLCCVQSMGWMTKFRMRRKELKIANKDGQSNSGYSALW